MTLMTTLALSNATPASATVDALVIGVHPRPGRRKGIIAPACLTAAARRRLEEVASALGATGAPGNIVKLPGTGIAKAPVVIAVGLGAGTPDAETARRAAGIALRSLAGNRRVGIVIDDPDPDKVENAGLGALLGAYSFDEFRGTSAAKQPAKVRSVMILADPKSAGNKEAIARAHTIANAVCLSRDLVNTPPSALPPAMLADAAIAAVADLDVAVEVWTEKDLSTGGFGGILAVGQGSANPPRLVAMRYAPADAVSSIALVGKGITFDSGGLSLKPPKAMETMKCDMSGAAAVIGAVQAIAALGLPVTVTGWLPIAENMPSGHAQRPGDVITIYGGQTVEVLNTDAEGRLVLADALVRASEDSPDLIVDAATLTGAAVVALGDRTSGIMANDDAFRIAVWEASVAAGETMWHVPIPEESRASLDSAIADIKNIGDGKGGMLSAAAFLRDFVPTDTKWAHLDIAGPAFNDGSPYGYTPKGGTGAAVRTFVQIAHDAAEGRLP
ncbi:MAG: leucyl aminopeptidase [Candidatus Nanopelagicales bacterium]